MTGGGGRGIKQGIGVGDDNELEEGEHSAKCDVEVNYSFNSLVCVFLFCHCVLDD